MIPADATLPLPAWCPFLPDSSEVLWLMVFLTPLLGVLMATLSRCLSWAIANGVRRLFRTPHGAGAIWPSERSTRSTRRLLGCGL